MPISGAVTWQGLTTPLTRQVASGCYLCAGTIYVVLLGYPTSSITLVSSLREIPTVVAASSLPLWGNTDVVLAGIKRNFWRRCRGDIINIYQVPNHKSHLLSIYIICHLPLVFLSPTSQKFVVLFALFFVCRFSRQICFCVQSCLCSHDASNKILWCSLPQYFAWNWGKYKGIYD